MNRKVSPNRFTFLAEEKHSYGVLFFLDLFSLVPGGRFRQIKARRERPE
jgi:hypothetical protein